MVTSKFSASSFIPSFVQKNVFFMSVVTLAFLSLSPCKVEAGPVTGNETYDLGYLCGDSFARKLGLSAFGSNFSSRGVIRPIVGNMTSEESTQMGTAGVFSWNMRVEFVRTEEEARERVALFKANKRTGVEGTVVWPIFVVSDDLPKLELGQDFDMYDFFRNHRSAKVVAVEPHYAPTNRVVSESRFYKFFRKLKSWWLNRTFDLDGEETLDVIKFKTILKSYWKDVTWTVIKSYLWDGQPAVVSSGVWTAPKVRGVIVLEDWNGSDTIKKVRKNRATLLTKGFTIEVNNNNAEALRLLTEQTRRNKTAAENRFADADTFREAEQRLKDGTAFEVSLVENSTRKALAGALFYLSDGIVSAETVFYPEQLETDKPSPYGTGIKPIDLAKVVAVAAGDLLAENGATFIDVQMVTGFTSVLKAQYVTAQRFFQIIREEQLLGNDFRSIVKPE